jgi:hypothetical protein
MALVPGAELRFLQVVGPSTPKGILVLTPP